MNIVDIIIIILLLLSILGGVKRGALRSIVTLVGTIVVFILAYFLKTPISILMYEHLPFFSIGGIFENITTANILIYEGLSFVITLFGLIIILKILEHITGLADKILSKLVLLGIPGKIIGGIVGFIQGYLIIFVVLFLISSFTKPSQYILDSKLSNIISNKTPMLSNVINDSVSAVSEIYDICINNNDREQADLESLDILMKYDILSYKSANKLIESGKLKMNNASSVIEKYKEDN